HGPRRRPGLLALAGAIALGAAALLAAAIICVRTDRGVLGIEADEREVKVVVEQEGRVVTLIDLKTDRRVELRSGRYRVKLEGRDDLVLDVHDFDMERNGQVVARVRRRPADAVPPDPGELAKKPCPADALQSRD